MFTRKNTKILVHTTLAASQRRHLKLCGFALLPFTSPWQQPFLPGLTGVFRASLACYYCLSLLSIIQITTMLIHMHGVITRASPLAAGVGSARCQPLFCAVTTGDCCSVAHCWASFAWCKSAHVGHGDKYGCAPGPVLD